MPRQTRTLLALPPNYSYIYNFPPLGTPCLAGFLKAKGYPVLQADWNVDYLDFMSERMGLDPSEGPRRDILLRFLLNKLYEKKAARGLYYSHFLTGPVDELTPYEDNTNSSFHFTERMLSSDILERYLDDDEENTFRQFFLARGLAEKIIGSCDVLGLSLISPSQAIASLTLCRLIKEERPDFPILWGGQWPSLFRKELADWGKLHRFADGVIIDEGETPLLRYLEAKEGRGSIADVPNLLYFDGPRPYLTGKRSEEDMSELPAPDFDGMPLGRYFYQLEDGVKTATYQTSRECYWNRCTYCVDLPFPKHTYREKPVDLVIRDIRELKARYGTEELILSDLAMAPHYMRKLSERIIEEGINVRWWTFSRLDGDLSRELFDLAHKAGCYRISYGFESANQRVCDAIDKGTRLATMSKVIKSCGSSGIKVTLQTMIGLPTETAAEALDTIAFLLEHRRYIDHVGYNVYYLTPGNYIYRDLDKNRLKVDDNDRLPFQFFIPFNHADETGLGRERAKALLRFYERRLEALERRDKALPAQAPEPEWETFRPVFHGGAALAASLVVGRERQTIHCRPTADGGHWLFLEEGDHRLVSLFDGKSTAREIAERAGGGEERLKRILRLCRGLHADGHWTSAQAATAAVCP